jgi:hypothetical protein
MSITNERVHEWYAPGEYNVHSCGSGLDLAEPLTGVSCIICGKPMIRRKGEPISCTLDKDGNPICVRVHK